jgi:hypothetical protein
MKTLKVYKLFTIKNNKLYPLFIGKKKSLPMNEWLQAEYIPTKGFAHRPGWHTGRLPIADHLLKKDGTMAKNRVWVEVEIKADVDWQSVADSNKTRDIPNTVPANGYYVFKRPKSQGGEWLIAGDMKINRILDDVEVEKIVMENICK